MTTTEHTTMPWEQPDTHVTAARLVFTADPVADALAAVMIQGDFPQPLLAYLEELHKHATDSYVPMLEQVQAEFPSFAEVFRPIAQHLTRCKDAGATRFNFHCMPMTTPAPVPMPLRRMRRSRVSSLLSWLVLPALFLVVYEAGHFLPDRVAGLFTVFACVVLTRGFIEWEKGEEQR